jgi:hypothetical protein
MYKKLLFKRFVHGYHDADGVFVNTGRSWCVGGVQVHESDWDKYNFRVTGTIPELPTVDWSLKYRQAEIQEYTKQLATVPQDLRDYFETRYING